MIGATAELIAWLNSTTQGVSIPVITITLRSGTVLRWARNSADVTFGGTTWLAHGRSGRPLITSYRWRSPVGLEEIGTAEVVLGLDTSTVIGSERLALAAAKGVFKDARLLIERVYADTRVATPVGKLFRWSGKIQAAPGDSHIVRLTAESAVASLRAAVLPKTLISPTCQNALYDAACGVSRASNTLTRTVAAGGTKTTVPLTVSDASGSWAGGVLTVTSGALNGEKRPIRSSGSSAVVLGYPLPAALAAGVTVTVTRGCDRTTGAGGCSKFSNLARWRGVASLPQET